MPIIDSQVHAYEANTPRRPWHTVPNWPPHVTGDEMVAAMDKVGVDGAVFISAFSLYQYDASYAVDVQRKYPGRFAIIKPVNPADPAVGEVIAEWKKQPGAVAVRIMMTTREAGLKPDDPGLDRQRVPDVGQRVGLAREGAGAAHFDQRIRSLCERQDLRQVGPGLRRRRRRARLQDRHVVDDEARVGMAIDERCARLEVAPEKHVDRKALPRCFARDAHLRCLGLRALPVGDRLDARLRGSELRAGRGAVPQNRSPERERARHADGRRLREGLRLVAKEKLAAHHRSWRLDQSCKSPLPALISEYPPAGLS